MIKQFKSKDKVLVLDFDHTCYDTDDFLLNEIRQPMLNRFKIPADIWEKSYKEALKVGYTLEQHRKELIKIKCPESFSLAEIKTFGQAIKFDGYLYSDVIPFIKEAKRKGYRVILLSFGATSWQDAKVFGSGLNKFMDNISYLTKEFGKVDVLKRCAPNCKEVIFVDNKVGDLDAVRKALPHVKTYLINRVPDYAKNAGGSEDIRIRFLESRMIAEAPVSEVHKRCRTLTEVVL